MILDVVIGLVFCTDGGLLEFYEALVARTFLKIIIVFLPLHALKS